jgi:tricarballylate dehydrogenase
LLRLAFDTPDALLRLIPDVQTEVPDFVAGVAPYPAEAFWSDLLRVTRGGIDPDLGELLVSRSFETACWMVGQGIRMEAAVSLAAIEFDGVVKWPSGAVVRTVDEGVGLSRMWFEVASRRGIALRYQTGAQRLVQDRSGRIGGVVVRDPDGISQLDAGSVVLACGGFEANPEWRARYLQRPWDMARVRGTAYNTGDGLRMALELGALPFGQWSGNHGTPIDADAPPFGDRHLTDKTNRLSYPLGVMVNTDGDRFIDEGEDFQLYTYAKTGGAILQQPGNVAYQIFDAKVTSLLEPRYVTGDPLVADTLDELIDKLPVGKTRLKESLIAYNAAEGERDSAGHRVGPKRWGIKGLRPVAFTRCESFSFQSIVYCRVKGNFTNGSVVGDQRLFQPCLTNRQLVDQFVKRISHQRITRHVAGLE